MTKTPSKTLKFNYSGLQKVISGGQVGVDQGALFAAFDTGILTGGMAPLGYKVSGGSNQLLRAFGLAEHHSSDYPPRTEENVKAGDATLLIACDPTSAGEVLTLKLCRKHTKPHLLIHVQPLDGDERGFFESLRAAAAQAAAFVKQHQVRVLNVAGNRDSEGQTVMFDITSFILKEVFALLDYDNLLIRDSDL